MLSRIDRRSHVFVRGLREALRASLGAKIVALASVVDLGGGLRRVDGHSADGVCGQVESLPKFARVVNEFCPRFKSRRYHLRQNPALGEGGYRAQKTVVT